MCFERESLYGLWQGRRPFFFFILFRIGLTGLIYTFVGSGPTAGPDYFSTIDTTLKFGGALMIF